VLALLRLQAPTRARRAAALPPGRRRSPWLAGAAGAALAGLGPGAAAAAELRWDLAAPEGAVVEIALQDGDAAPVQIWRCADGKGRRQGGWRPDEAPAPGRVAGRVAEVWLPPGDWQVVLSAGGRELERRPFPSDSAPRLLSTRLPDGSAALRAERWSPESGADGFSYGPDAGGGISFLGLSAGEWEVVAVGRPDLRARPGPTAARLELKPAPTPRPRSAEEGHPWLIRGLLIPATALSLGLLLAGLGGRRPRGLGAAAAACALLAGALLWPALRAPAQTLLMRGDQFEDPVTSATLAAVTADAALRLGDGSALWGWPEGHSWLALGPSWLAYLLVAPVSWAAGGVVAHNIGQWLLLTGVGLGGWLLARARGCGPGAAGLGAAAAALAPPVIDELDKGSLDRLGLGLIPVFLLALDRAITRGGRWIPAAAAALSATLLLQTYYGLYLAAACPLLVLPRLLGEAPHRRLLRAVGVGVLGLTLMGPTLYVLREGTQDTVYAEAPGAAGAAPRLGDLLPDRAQVEDHLRRYDPRLGGVRFDRPMATPTERLLTAMANATPLKEVLVPGSTLLGRSAYWGAAAVALLLARRRRAAALGVWDVAVFLGMALGPVVRTGETETGPTGPYALYHVLIPGFDQLKHPSRFTLLAAVAAGAPLALGLQGALDRLARPLPRAARALALPLAALLGGLGTGLHLIPVHDARDRRLRGIPVGDPDDPARQQVLVFDQALPVARAFPADPALLALPPGPALAFPLAQPMAAEVSVAIAQAGLPVVNPAPHGIPSRRPLPPLVEDHALLNHLAILAGSDRARLWQGGPGGAAELAAVRALGLRYVLVFPEALEGGVDPEPLIEALDARLPRVATGPTALAWELR
jgi:hypothetical protein